MRASEHQRTNAIVNDPYARAFVEPALVPAAHLGPVLDALEPVRRSGMHNYIATRHAWIDAQVLTTEPDQVLVLGAGYDTRARRLAGPTYWEVDHPATAARKRRIDPTHPAVRVDVDFERQSLIDRLLAEGFTGGPRTTVIWEGVSMYLTEAAFRHTLQALREMVPADTPLVFDALAPLDVRTPRGLLTRLGAGLMPLLGEPVRLTLDADRLDQVLASEGWKLTDVQTARQLGKRYGRFVFPPAYVARCERR